MPTYLTVHSSDSTWTLNCEWMKRISFVKAVCVKKLKQAIVILQFLIKLIVLKYYNTKLEL